jgi:hypothetical protein
MTRKNFAIRNSEIKADFDTSRIFGSIDRLAKSIISGRIEHEILADLQLILDELKAYISAEELDLLAQALRNGAVAERRLALESAITAQLKIYADQAGLVDPQLGLIKAAAFDFFSEKDPSLLNNKLNSGASFFIFLRDLAFEITGFIQQSVGDSLENFLELVHLKQQLLEARARLLKLNKQDLRAANEFLQVSAALVLLHKVELVANDYLKSDTDLEMASGQVWASRYHRSDYIPFMISPIDSLRENFSFLFLRKVTVEQLNAIRVKLKVERISHGNPTLSAGTVSLRTRLQEVRALFGVALNLIFTEKKSTLRLLIQILDNKSVQALESEDKPSQFLKQKISRVRFYIQLLSALSLVPEHNNTVDDQLEPDKQQALQKTLAAIHKVFIKAKFELEVVGLSTLKLGIDGLQHGNLEGLSNWVLAIIQREHNYYKYLAAEKHGIYEQAYQYFSDFLLQPLLIDGQAFSILDEDALINSRTGSSEAGFFFSLKIKVFNKKIVTRICAIFKQNPFLINQFCMGFPVLTRVAAEFQDFDRGTALMLAHRHLLLELHAAGLIPKEFELIVDIIDAEVRHRHGLRSPDSIVPQRSAVEWLEKNSPKSIDLKIAALNSIDLQKAFYQCAETTISNAITGQFMSAEIRLLSALVGSSKSKRLAKNLSKLVIDRVSQRLIVSNQELAWFNGIASSQVREICNNSLTSLRLREIESRALTATQMLLDCSLTCAFLGDQKIYKKILDFCVETYGRILPGLAEIVKWILASDSIEEFRRRVEKSMKLVQEEAEADSLLFKPDSSGASLGFFNLDFSGNLVDRADFSELFSSLALVSHLRRRQIVAGRCSTLERYQEAYHSLKLQNLFISSVFAINDSLYTERRAARP